MLRSLPLVLVPLLVSNLALADHPNLELGFHGGIAFPHCFDRCAGDLHSGTTLGGFGLIRPVDWGAIGISADAARFGWEARDSDFVDRESSTTASFIGLTGRYYALDQALFDVYAQVAAGVAFVDSPSGTLVCKQPAGPALELALGYETKLSNFLRFSASAASVIARPSSACEDADRVKNLPPPTPSVAPVLMLRLGFTFGASIQSSDEELE